MLDPTIKTRCRADQDCNPGRMCSAERQCVPRGTSESETESPHSEGELGEEAEHAGGDTATGAEGSTSESELDAGLDATPEQAEASDAHVDATVAPDTPDGAGLISIMTPETSGGKAGSGGSPQPSGGTPIKPEIAPTCACEPPEVHVRWSFPASELGFYNIDQPVKVRSEVASVAWFEDVYFVGETGVGARIGFESQGLRPDGTIGKVALFTMYGATDASGLHCQPSTDPIPGTTCRVAFEFTEDEAYVWRIWKQVDDAATWWWWGAWVRNARETQPEVPIGELRGPPGRSFIQRSDIRVHHRDLNSGCEAPFPSSASFSPPLLDASAMRAQTAVLGEDAVTGCRTAQVKPAAGGVDVTFGAP